MLCVISHCSKGSANTSRVRVLTTPLATPSFPLVCVYVCRCSGRQERRYLLQTQLHLLPIQLQLPLHTTVGVYPLRILLNLCQAMKGMPFPLSEATLLPWTLHLSLLLQERARPTLLHPPFTCLTHMPTSGTIRTLL